MDDDLEETLRRGFRLVGRRFEETKRAYREGLTETSGDGDRFDVPIDEEGNARIVCRRHGERRSVPIDEAGRPVCFEADHPDCEGCLEDIQDGYVETW
ncbi:hypothetical protein ACERIT_10250 [Halopenitus sp. H-Gu1]|uniref:DUF7091 family protein n=1 Tax=Halopenitus sp. H-Gu1 TaxID=3242697 RepID=UPI00359DEEE0